VDNDKGTTGRSGDLMLSAPRTVLSAARLVIFALAIVAMVIPGAALAQGGPSPRDIALTPADLPPGFLIVPSETGQRAFGDGALLYRVRMLREPTPENVLDGPIFVEQIIIRTGGDIGAGEGLAIIRDSLLARGLEPTNEGPNDGGTISLKGSEGDATVYAVGFVKQNFIIFTVWAGLTGLVDFPGLMQVAGISSAKLDAATVR
jgi:hypothetical protein